VSNITTLEFEKPIVEMEQKLGRLKNDLTLLKSHGSSASHEVEIENRIALMEKQIEQKKKEIYDNLTPWQRIQIARHPGRPLIVDYIKRVFTDFIELHGDRLYQDDQAIIGGFATLDSEKLVLIGSQKGRNIRENIKRNFGCAHPEGYRKALRLMKLADKFRLPIVTLVDTAGAYPGIGAEERHIGESIALNLKEMFSFRVPIVSAIVGEGGSGGALALAVANRVLVLENAYYSVISPEGCAAILWKDRAATPKAAETLHLTAQELKKFRLVDEVISEPLGGAHKNIDEASRYLKGALIRHLTDLSLYSPDGLVQSRYDKFRNFGEVCPV